MHETETLTRLRSDSRVRDIKSDSIVDDRELDSPRSSAKLYPYIFRLRVPRDVGESLLHDPEAGSLDSPGKSRLSQTLVDDDRITCSRRPTTRVPLDRFTKAKVVKNGWPQLSRQLSNTRQGFVD